VHLRHSSCAIREQAPRIYAKKASTRDLRGLLPRMLDRED
jgi:hypothetical protein